ncbi:MAG: CotH kinase family protein [Cyclobacteriaceae bacterium]
MKNLAFLFSLLLLISCGDDSDNGGTTDPTTDPTNPTDPVTFAVDIGDSEIPYIVINTGGQAIENEPKIPATMKVYVQSAEILSGNIGIEYRGSTSFRISDKKSFGIETWDMDGNDTDMEIFGFPEEEDWILNGHVVNLGGDYAFDRTLMYHYFGYNLYRDMGRYASRTRFVELELNGQYLGVYVFMEKLKRDKERINIEKLNPEDNEGEAITGGYILKIDKTAGGDLNINQPLEYFENNWADDARYTEQISFRSQYDIFGEPMDIPPYGEPYHSSMFRETYFLYEEPAADEITTQQKDYIADYVHQFETALLNDDFSTEVRTYTDYIDINSFVDYFLLNEIVRNVDGYRLSTYLQKDRGGKLAMGPVWDLNIGYDTGDRVPLNGWVINYNDYVDSDAWMMPFWWPRLLEDPVFRTAVKNRWNELRGSTLSTSRLQSLVDQNASYLIDNGAVDRNYSVWSLPSPVNYTESVASLREYLENRTLWMDQEIQSF